jgi:hypothetical protein
MKNHADFDIRYDSRLKRNYWILGYFGGGSVNVLSAYNLATFYSEDYNVPLESIQIDEVLQSRRYKGFKFLYSAEKMEADMNASISENVFSDLTQ